MDDLITEIRRALEAGLWTIALQSTLAAVDICGALQSVDGRASGSKFRAWFVANIQAQYPMLDPEDMYQLRCGMLHQGRAHGSQYSAIVFTLPDGRGNFLHRNVMGSALNLDLSTFCTEILDLVQAWWATNQGDATVSANAEHMARVRPQGLAPFIVGVPVLA